MAAKGNRALLREMQSLFSTGCSSTLSDAELLNRFVESGDERAFESLVGRHGSLVWSLALSAVRDPHQAEDVFQAVFLVLVTKARSIRSGESIASWLYKVTLRLANDAMRDLGRNRRRFESFVEHVRIPDRHEPPTDDSRNVILDELARLPARYRDPIILCRIEGLTYIDAARRLNWSESTLRNRLSRGRSMFRSRLSKRGVGLTVPLLPARLLELTLEGQRLAQETIRLAALLVRGRSIAYELGTTAVATLVRRGSAALSLARLRSAAVICLVVGSMAVAGLAVSARMTTPQRGVLESNKPTFRIEEQQGKEEDGLRTIRGRVVDPSGVPVEGAKVYLPVWMAGENWTPDRLRKCSVRATTDSSGEFMFELPEPELKQVRSQQFNFIYAFAPGFGFAWQGDAKPAEGKEFKLQLVKDNAPFRGRLIDLEGRPIEGVNVSIRNMYESKSGALDDWLDAARKGELAKWQARVGDLGAAYHNYGFGSEVEHAPHAATNADGRFELKGIGRERIVELHFEGPTIRSGTAYAATRKMSIFRGTWILGNYVTEMNLLYGSEFELSFAPSVPIIGVVKDKATGKGVAGVSVWSYKFADDPIPVVNYRSLHTRTDEHGRFRLIGMPKGKTNEICVDAMPDAPYFFKHKKVPGSPGLEPASVEIQLTKGMILEGSVGEKGSEKPGRGYVQYHAYRSNPSLSQIAQKSEFQGNEEFYFGRSELDGSGKFRLLVPPGRGVVSISNYNGSYTLLAGRAGYDAKQLPDVVPEPNPQILAGFTEVDIKEGESATRVELSVEAGRQLRGTILDPEGKPLDGALFCSHHVGMGNFERLEGHEFAIKALEPLGKSPQSLNDSALFALAIHHEKRLGGWLRRGRAEPGPVCMKLEPCGSVIGRLLDRDGAPKRRTDLHVVIVPNDPNFAPEKIGITLNPLLCATDDDGQFRIDTIIPGLPHRISTGPNGVRVVDAFVVKPGEAVDKGEIRLKK